MKQTAKKRNGTRPSNHERENASLPLLDAFRSLLLCLGVALLLLVAASLAAYFAPDPDVLIPPLGLSVAALTSFLGGYLTLRRHRHSALMCGLLFGMLLTLLSLPLGVLLSSRGVAYPLWAVILMRTAVVLLSVIGSFCALRSLERAPKRKRRKHA